jgi:uncharacterized protein (TIGR02271 family)
MIADHHNQETEMSHTIVAVYDEYGDAQSAMNALFTEGAFTQADVKLSPAEDTHEGRQQALRSQQDTSDGGGWSIGGFISSLFSSDQHTDDAGVYSEAVRRGGYMVSVDAQNEEQVSRAADILQRFHAVDLDQRASHWRSSGWTAYRSDAPLYTAEEIRNDRERYTKTTVASTEQPSAAVKTSQAIPVIEEQLQVGKRTVQRGGVRIYRHVTETPVQESVQLREEHLTIERTAVDQPASVADIEAFKEGVTEVRETAEEPVIGKTARVVEQVRVGKEVTEHSETIHDTVRRTDVNVEQLGTQSSGMSGATTLGEDDFRTHWQTAYGSSGQQYEDYASAYRYGADLAKQQKYYGYRWDELEPQVRSDWEASHADSPWERSKQAVRYGWEKMTGH